ncbi:hypothetical protein J7L87_05910 [bacterium]|nr:hypothetical protein [bacterium]
MRDVKDKVDDFKTRDLEDAVIYVILLIGLDGRKEIGGWYIEFGKENRTDWIKIFPAKKSVGSAMYCGGNDLISFWFKESIDYSK